MKRSGRIRVRSGTADGFDNVVRLADEEWARERLARIDITSCSSTTIDATTQTDFGNINDEAL